MAHAHLPLRSTVAAAAAAHSEREAELCSRAAAAGCPAVVGPAAVAAVLASYRVHSAQAAGYRQAADSDSQKAAGYRQAALRCQASEKAQQPGVAQGRRATAQLPAP
jgi:hypothetical protein